jgi:hypothetical protein
MASCCSCGGCGCSRCNYTVVLPSEAPEVLSFQNVNVGGVGVLDSATQPNINFRGVASANALATVTLDAANHNILLTLDSAAIAAALPAAITTQTGVLETATDAEAIAKAATDKIVTPSNFAAMASSSTFAGFVELATNAETQAGASSTLAVTPAGLLSVTALQKTTTTFADAVARAALAPTFEGQFGYQLDTNNPYVARGTSAGNWNNLLAFGISNTIPAGNATGVTFGAGASFDWTNGDLSFIDVNVQTGQSVGGTTWAWSTGTTIDYNGGIIQNGGVTVPAASVLTTAGLGVPSSRLLNTFISTANTQTGYTNFTNPAVLRTCDTATVTLPQLAQIVGTLINDLKAVLLPAT